MRGSASAPGSSANLGPGFDRLAIALEVRCQVEAEPADDWIVDELGVTRPGEKDEWVVRAAGSYGDGPFHLRIKNDIPSARGLGSSAAVAAASAAAAIRARGDEPDAYELFQMVADLEGHPDNAAATVYGGVVLVGVTVVRQIELWGDLVPVAAIPDTPLNTDEARDVLPTSVPLDVASRTAGRLAFLIEGLRTGDQSAFDVASGDELHELPRADLSPVTGALIATATKAGAAHAAWSGAGPTVLALVASANVEGVMAALSEVLGDDGDVMQLEVARQGLI